MSQEEINNLDKNTDKPLEDDLEVENDEQKDISQAILVMLFLLVINELLLWLLSKLKQRFKFMKPVQPTTITTLLGIFAGIILNIITRISSSEVHIVNEIKSSFANFFLIVLLPPILYESAINIDRKHFFKNFGSILALAIIGTIIATFITSILTYLISYMGLQKEFTLNTCFAFGSLISATDPVAVLSIFKQMNTDQTIYTLIFGESTLNDAVAMILYDTSYEMQGKDDMSYGQVTGSAIFLFLITFLGSIFIGVIVGCICAYMLKDGRSSLNTEIQILVCIPWVTYLLGSMFKLSGILSIMACGITMARYALPNITSTGKKINERFYHTLAYNFENLVFLFIGIGIVSFNLYWKQMGFFFFILVFIIINLARYINIKICSYFLNKYRLRHPINKVTEFLLWFSGFRGAMAYALALQSTTQFTKGDAGEIMLTITLIYAAFNIFINASVLDYLIIKLDITEKKELEIDHTIQRYDGFWNNIRDMIALFDENCLQRVLITNEYQQEQLNQSEIKNKKRESDSFMHSQDNKIENHNEENTQQEHEHDHDQHQNEDLSLSIQDKQLDTQEDKQFKQKLIKTTSENYDTPRNSSRRPKRKNQKTKKVKNQGSVEYVGYEYNDTDKDQEGFTSPDIQAQKIAGDFKMSELQENTNSKLNNYIQSDQDVDYNIDDHNNNQNE